MELLRGMIARGAGNTPDAIMLRLLWLRQEHPEAQVMTEALHIAEDRVVIRARIALSGGGAGSGIAAATLSPEGDWAALVEGTETIAISRALDTLGYVLRAAEQTVPAPEPTGPRQEPPPTPEPTSSSGPEPAEPSHEESPASPTPRREPARMQETAPPVVNALRRARRPQAPEPPAPETPGEADDVHLEDYSWNSFWARARELGLSPPRVTEILGRPANESTPREAIDELTAAGAWPRDTDA